MLRRKTAIATVATVALLLCATVTYGQTITNPGFESGFTDGVGNGWTIFGYASASFGTDETTIKHGGSHSQKIDFPPAPGYGGVFQTITTTAGQLYKINFWIYTFVANGESYDEEKMETFFGYDCSGRDEYDHNAYVANSDWNVGWTRVNISQSNRETWMNFDREFLATGTSTTLFVRGVRKTSSGTSMYLDDFSVSTTSNYTSPDSNGIVAPSTAPTLSGNNMLTNPEFETGFTNGVGSNWTSWTTTGSGTFAPSSDIGKIGGGHYNGTELMMTLSQSSKVAFAMPPMIGILPSVKAANPDIVTCARIDATEPNYWDCDDDQTITYGRARADLSYTESQYHPGVDCWQGYNEPGVDHLEQARKTALFEYAFTERCHELGIRSLVINMAVGSPSANNTPLWRDVLAIADFVGYHAYGGPTYGVQVSPNELDFALRWRGVVDYYETNDLRMPPCVYTEGGTYGPWKDDWSKSEITEEYIDFGDKMMEDEWNIGETIFTLGCFGFWCGWDIGDGDIIDAFVEWNEDNSADARGGKAQKIQHDGSAAFEGGLAQAVSTVADGEYWLSGWLKYETGNGGDPIEPDMAIKIGYDPTGQISNGNAGSIVWSSDQITNRYLPSHMWHDFGLSVEADGTQTSIWFALSQSAAGTTGKLWIDDLDMRLADGSVPPENNPPTAVASATPVTGDVSLVVNFDGTGSSDPDSDPLSYTWNYDDGTANGTGSTPTHTFTAAGTYNVLLTVDDGNGGSDTDTVTITVNSTGGGTASIVNGDFSDGLTGWSQWTERGTITFSNDSGRGKVSGNNINGGFYQQFSTGGVDAEIDITGWWATDPTVANYQWSEVLIINGDRLPSNGSDINASQNDVEMIYKNDTWESTSGWSGDMDQTAPVANVGTFTADDTVATIVLKMGNGGGSTSGTLFDNLVVTEATALVPTISLSPTSLSPSTTEGSSPTLDTFTITNSGDGTLNYTVSDNQTWLSVSPTSGSSTGEADTITVTYSTASLADGSYYATITVDDDAASNGPQTIAVTLTVNEPPPIIGLSTSTLSPSCDEGEDATSDSFTVENDGGGTLSYSITDDVTWLSVSPTSGSSTGEQDTITVNYDTDSLAAGSHSATITVSDSNAGNSPQTIDVSLTVDSTSTLAAGWPTGTDVAMNATQVATDSNYNSSYEGDNAIDGVISLDSRWVSTAGSSTHWLKLDLGASYDVDGFVIRHAGAAGEPTSYNTADFQIQSSASYDGTWTDEIAVTDSTASVTAYKYDTAKQLRYVRLYITDAGVDNYVRLPEFEVIGDDSSNTMADETPSGSNVALDYTQVATDSNYSSSYPGDDALDGVISLPSRWVSTASSSTHWLKIDLGANKTVNGFIVRLASTAGEQTYYNLSAFKIQSSTSYDGTWTDETVVDNSAQSGVINRTYDTPKLLRYIRLYITDAGIDDYVRLPEFEVRGQ